MSAGEPDPDRSELLGRTALVTGAARGIGRAISRELARRGARVVCVARSGAELAETCRLVQEAGGVALPLCADITAEPWLGELDALAPEVDLLVNNAAAFAPYAPLERVPEHEIERVLATGLSAALRLARHVVGGMKRRGYGRLVHIGSAAAHLGGAGQVAYSTAKAGLRGLSATLAVEGGRRGVTSNVLELGLVETERTLAALTPAVRAALLRSTPVGRPATPEEVAHAVAFLSSPRAAFLTGAVLPFGGGLGLGLFPEQQVG